VGLIEVELKKVVGVERKDLSLLGRTLEQVLEN
jgi:hypothetical protein